MATYVIDKGENYHVTESGEGYVINFSDGNKLYSQRILDLPQTAITIGYCDEKIPLYDGKFLVRVRDSLTISED